MSKVSYSFTCQSMHHFLHNSHFLYNNPHSVHIKGLQFQAQKVMGISFLKILIPSASLDVLPQHFKDLVRSQIAPAHSCLQWNSLWSSCKIVLLDRSLVSPWHSVQLSLFKKKKRLLYATLYELYKLTPWCLTHFKIRETKYVLYATMQLGPKRGSFSKCWVAFKRAIMCLIQKKEEEIN